MSRREVIEVPGFAHGNPIPAAVRIGQFLATGALTGRDPLTHQLPPGLDAQVANVFARIRAVLSAAGGGPGDLLKLTVWLADPGDRVALNQHWVAMFPDPLDRPARQVIAAQLPDGQLVQCDLLAVLDAAASGDGAAPGGGGAPERSAQ